MVSLSRWTGEGRGEGIVLAGAADVSRRYLQCTQSWREGHARTDPALRDGYEGGW